MLAEFRLYHKAGGDHQDRQIPEGFWHFGTCMRSIVVSLEDRVPTALKDYDFYKGESAYQFLLEVICGMHSPLLGETEILGQFKNFHREHNAHWPSFLKEIIQALNADAKIIRQKHLQNLGSHSYGSLLRKTLNQKVRGIDFLGAGHLVEEILPWFKKSHLEISVYTRNPSKHENLQSIHEGLSLKSFDQLQAQAKRVLVIAAPLSSVWLDQNVDLNLYDQVIDLRGDCLEDPIDHRNLKNLHHLFKNIEERKNHAKAIKEDAQGLIIESARRRYLMERPRPFGWEDLWACS